LISDKPVLGKTAIRWFWPPIGMWGYRQVAGKLQANY